MTRVLACALALGAALALTEVALRATSFRRQAWDPEFGWIVQPGSEMRAWGEGRGRSRWTVHGIRRDAPIPAGLSRVMVMGDSFTEAFQVNDDETFCAAAEASLARAGLPVPILNAGRASRSPADYVAQAPLYLQTFHPRWTVVQVNDADFEGDSWRTDKTHFVRDDATGELRVKVVETKGPNGRLRWRIYNEVVNRVALVPWALGRLARV